MPFTAAPKSPAEHTSHTVFPSLGALPSSHSVQASTPKPATHPDGQLRQSERSATKACVPGAHFWHAAFPLTVTSPSPHSKHAVESPALAHWSGHALHECVAASSNWPGKHASQLDCSVFVADPSAHSSHAAAPASSLYQSLGQLLHSSV